MDAPLLQVASVSARYGAVEVVSNVSLQVSAGSVVAIVGPNGAGKTSLLRAVCGQLTPASGEVSFDGRVITGQSTSQIARGGISLVPEGRLLFPDMHVMDNLLAASMTPRSRSHRKELLEDVFRLFPVLRDRAKQRAGSLSGGEQGMVAIGRGLMAAPRLLILDEPSLGLAPLLVREILGVLGRLRERGLAVLLVEQNVRQSLRVADYAYVMEGGRLVLEGTAASVANDPQVIATYLGVKPVSPPLTSHSRVNSASSRQTATILPEAPHARRRRSHRGDQ